MKKAIIIIISAIVVLGGTFAGLWFFTDVLSFLKPANENFSMQLDKILGTEENLSYSEYEADLNKLNWDGSYSADFNMKVNVNVPSSYMDYSDQRLLNASSLKIKYDYDAGSSKKATDITLAKDSKDVIKAQAIVDGSKISINSEDLYEKYLTFDYSKYESFCKKNNIEVDEDTKQAFDTMAKLNEVDYNKFAYDLAYISKEDYEDLQKRYDNLLITLIDEDKYTTKKNQKISVGSEDDVKTTAYSVTLTGEDAYDMTKKLIELMNGDKTLKKLIVDKYKIVQDYEKTYIDILETNDNDYSYSDDELPDLSESDITNAFDELLEELEDSKDDFKDIEGAVKVTIYTNKKNDPVKVEFEILDDEDDDEGTIIFTEELEKNKNTYVVSLDKIAKLTGSSSSNSYSSYSSSYSSSSSLSSIANSISEIKVVDEYEKSDDSRNGTLTVSAKASGSKYEEMLAIKYETINSDSEMKLKLNVTTPLSSAVSLDFEYDAKGLDTDTTDLTFKLAGKYSSYYVNVDITGTMKNKSDIPNLSSSNSVDLLEMTTDELTDLEKEIINNAADNLPNKLSKFGIDVTKDDILSMLPEETEEPTTEQTTEGENATEGTAEESTESTENAAA